MKEYLSIVRNQKYPTKFLLSRLLMAIGVSKFFTIHRLDYRLRFYPTPSSAEIWIDSQYERVEEKFLRRYTKSGDAVVDVGANIGVLTLLCAVIVGNLGKVFAIEAHPKIFQFLRGNVLFNHFNNITCFDVALGERSGTVLFSNKRWDEMNYVINEETANDSIEIQMCTLDDLPIDVKQISLLKIDVEGYEKFVLHGARNTLSKIKCIYFESNAKHFSSYGYTLDDILHLLVGQGFRLYKLLDGNSIIPIPNNYNSVETENLIAVREIDDFQQRTGFSLLNNH